MPPPTEKLPRGAYVDLPYLAALTTYLGYAVLIVFGHLRDTLDKLANLPNPFRASNNHNHIHNGTNQIKNNHNNAHLCAPLLSDFEDFYTRRLYQRINDCWGRPIRGRAGAWIDCLERNSETSFFPTASLVKTTRSHQQQQHHHLPDRRSPLHQYYSSPTLHPVTPSSSSSSSSPAPLHSSLTGRAARCLNLGSYNYLGYSEVPGGVHPSVVTALRDWGTSVCDTTTSLGRSRILRQLESVVASFLDKDESIVIGMGFATNSQIVSALVSKDDLIVSDALNHASIVVGARSSGAAIRVFEHNCAASLDFTLKDAILTGDPKRGGKPWRRILIVVEGMYSMEGETCRLREIIAVKKKYGAYLYLDEAHSIGALGASGRGVTEHLGLDTRDIDVMMGTFTKSFGAVGGYIAADADVIARIRALAPAALYASAMSPPCAQHTLWAFRQLMGEDGTDIGKEKIRSLRENAIYFRRALKRMGVQTLGDCDSPVIPIMLFNPAKIAAFSRECFQRGLAVVVVGFPATPLLLSRARICLSAAHTKRDLDWALSVIDEVADIIQIKYDRPLVERLLPMALAQKFQSTMLNLECWMRADGHEHCFQKRCLVAPSQ